MGFEIRENPDFSWSSSRLRLFEECQLCYGLYYYGSHNGWLRDASSLAKTSYRYKATRSIEERLMEAVTTKIYDHYYKEPVSQTSMRDYLRIELNKAVVASQHNKDDWYKRPKHIPVLREMVHSDKLPKGLVNDVTVQMNSIVDHFTRTKTDEELKQEHQLYHLSRFNQFTLEELDNLTVFVGIHLLYKQDGKLVAVNFKTTDDESHIDQLGSIALYLVKTYGVKLEDIVIRDEFLLYGTHKDYHLEEEDLDEMYEVIRDSVNMMSEMVVDGDLSRNEALPLEYFSRNPQHSDTCGVTNCSHCQLVEKDVQDFPIGVKAYAI